MPIKERPQPAYCESCLFYRQIKTRSSYGRCHRYPPVVVSLGDGDTAQERPVMANIDWCGDHTALTVYRHGRGFKPPGARTGARKPE